MAWACWVAAPREVATTLGNSSVQLNTEGPIQIRVDLQVCDIRKNTSSVNIFRMLDSGDLGISIVSLLLGMQIRLRIMLLNALYKG